MSIGRRGLLGLCVTLAAGRLHAQTPGRMAFITPQGLRLAYAPVLVGQAGGHFRAQGLDVSIIGGASSPQAVQQVVSGQALVGRTAGATLMSAVEHGGAVRSIATIAHGSPFYMISSGASPVNTPRDLVGGVVGVISQNGPSENALDAMLLSEGLDPKTVQRQYTGDNAGAYALLDAGRLRAFMGAVDTYLRATAAHANAVAFNTSKYMPLPGQVYVATDAAIAQQATTLSAFLRGVRAAIDFIVADTGKAETLRLVRSFAIEGASDDALSVAILNANQALWLSEGPANILRNIPDNWARGVDLAVRTGARPIDPAALYTNALL